MTVAIFQPSLATRLARAVRALFAAGEQGAWFDCSDLTSMFQDSGGTPTPVTAAAQPVGLMLDKRKGLALESDVVVNGGFDTDTIWIKGTGVTIEAGKAVFVNVGSGLDSLYEISILNSNSLYQITYTIAEYVSGGIHVANGYTGETRAENGTFTELFYTLSGNLIFKATANGTTLKIDDVVVRKVSGNHATQSTAAARPTLSARKNLLTYSEQFDNASWGSLSSLTISANATLSPNDSLTADALIETATTGSHYMNPANLLTVSVIQTVSFYVAPKTRNFFWCSLNGGANSAYFNLATGAVGTVQTGLTATITPASNGFFRCSVTGIPAHPGGLIFGPAAVDGSFSYTGDGMSGIYLWGAQLESGSTATRYQRIAAATDYDAVGFNQRITLDKVDDALNVTVPTGGFVGTMVLSTTQGTAAYGVNIPAGTHTIGGLYFPGTNIVGQLIRHGALSETEIASASAYMVGKGGGPAGSDAYAGVTSFTDYWRLMSWLTTFPLINTASVTNFWYAWYGCSSLNSFPLINTASATGMESSWQGCSGLTSFPLINTSAVLTLTNTWRACSALTSFPLLNMSAVTNASLAWYGCTSLANFPAGMFDTCPSTNFANTFVNCALTQTSVDNILVSIAAAGTSTGTLNMTGGTSATPGAAGLAAKATLVGRGWTVTHN